MHSTSHLSIFETFSPKKKCIQNSAQCVDKYNPCSLCCIFSVLLGISNTCAEKLQKNAKDTAHVLETYSKTLKKHSTGSRHYIYQHNVL